jgi:hypothetical protein
VTELTIVSQEILQEARILAVKAGATSSQPTQRELEAIKGALDRIQSGLNRIQTQTDAWADEPLEAACREWCEPTSSSSEL